MANEPTLVDDERETPSNVENVRGIEAKQLRNSVHERLFGSSGEPVKIGRYTVLKGVGAGGMGVVYAAYDTELDRKVAIKLMQIGGTRTRERARARLLREGQALARLSHPNVIQVYDVGEFQEQVFVAMEFIEGPTLKNWLREAERDWREVLAKFVEAGRGLVAAHAADIVHRDFKPANVMVGDDGRVRVLDFGLARPGGDRSGQYDVPESESVSGSASGSNVITSLTRPGSVMGTPAYMAPEQHAGKPADARSDQFSFCVALYEGLYGHRPFHGETRDELRAAVVRGEVLQPPAEHGVPRRLWTVLQRGLARKPKDRYESMETLLADLTWQPSRRRGMWLGGAALVAVTALVVHLAGGFVSPCADTGDELADAWNDARKAEIQRAFLATNVPFAEDAWRSISAKLDDYAARWSTSRVDTCEATKVRAEQSEAGHDLRMACLNARRAGFEATANLFAAADADVVENAVDAAESLPELAYCDDVELLTRGIRPPEDPETRTRVAKVRRSLAEVDALEHAGKYRDALALAVTTAETARALDYPPVLAESLYRLGTAHADLDQAEDALGTLNEAVDLAEAHRHDELAVRVWSTLVLMSPELGAVTSGHDWARRARAAIRKVGDQPALEAELEAHVGFVYYAQGKLNEAKDHLVGAVADQRELLDPDDLRLVSSLGNLATVQTALGDFASALASYDEALAVATGALGPRHPKVASVLFNTAALLIDAGEIDRGEAHLRRVAAIFTGTYGANGLPLGHVHTALSKIEMQRGNLGRAEEEAAAAERIYDAHGDAARHDKALAINSRGSVLLLRERHEDALAAFRRALEIQIAVLGEQTPDVALQLSNVGAALTGLGRHEEATASFDESRRLLEATVEPKHPFLAYPIGGKGRARLAAGEPAAALPLLEEALALLEPHPEGDPPELAELRWSTARVLRALGRDPERAKSLATAARATFEALGPAWAKRVRAVDEWLKTP